MSGIMTRKPMTSSALPWSDYPRFGQRVRRRYAEQLPLLPNGLPDRAAMQSVFDALRATGLDLAGALRATRQLVLERLLVLDCDQGCELGAVTACMTQLAEWALNLAFEASQQALEQIHGQPLGVQGEVAQLCIVGMGKLGARELNVSRDIDLIYLGILLYSFVFNAAAKQFTFSGNVILVTAWVLGILWYFFWKSRSKKVGVDVSMTYGELPPE